MSGPRACRRRGAREEELNRKATLTVFILFLGVALTSLTVPPTRAETQPEQLILPVPYYSQGPKPYCVPTVVRMALAYIMYPNEPPTLEQLLSEMGTSDIDGTKFSAVPYPFMKRGLSTLREITYPNCNEIDGAVSSRKTVFIGLDQGQRLWHAILVIGFVGDNYLIHDPARGPGRFLAKSDLVAKWKNGMILGCVPASVPSYTVNIVLSHPVSPIYVNGRSRTGLLTLPIGIEYTLSVLSPVVVSNESVQVTYFCSPSSRRIRSWTTEPLEVSFEYYAIANYRVRVMFSLEDQKPMVEEAWVRHGETFVRTIEKTTYSMRGFLGIFGSVMRFDGWYCEGRLVGIDSTLTLTVLNPMVIEAKWREDHSMTLVLFLTLTAVGLVGYVLFKAGRDKQQADA